MTQEEKELLIKDLCARLLYGVECEIRRREGCTPVLLDKLTYGTIRGILGFDWYVQPYLRPMSSMTEEEQKALKEEQLKDERLFAECLTKCKNGDDSMRGKIIPHFAADWCDKKHFDYRGLIPLGLALEAPEGMYIN